MTPRRAASLAVGIAAHLVVRVLVRLRPQRWLPPAISLRVFRFSSRTGFELTVADLRRHQPARTWTTRTDLVYAPTGRDGLFDLVVPDGPGPHPWVLWVHGGGWHFGSKAYPLPYLEVLAARGIAGVAVNYPLAPEARYPAAPRAVNDAVAHLLENAASYDLDPDRMVLAGDSAGAQVAAEVAVLATSPAFAAATGLTPAAPGRVRGTVLFCGIYDAPGLGDSDRFFEAGLESAMWALSGRRDWTTSEACRLMSVRDHVTAAFPPTFLAAGNADPLTRRQTPLMAARLRELGVEVDELSPGSAEDPVGHEFQFWLGTPAGAEALDRVEAFVGKVVAP